ncbi:hypothetical protein RJ639_030464 [Escallonia herrerae]|uniref:Ankyrin n=1 Tax=Escallonia herrerae TaxID=1293975 RepID=A0AA89BMU6_9ASTE|nr:hypothetical protein RJ639_030464 [Escallonia herrerae]
MTPDASDALADLAAQLDDGKGLPQTVADVKDANKRGALHFAAREGQTDVCKYLLEELKLDGDTKDEDGETPVLHAARQGHTTTAKYLIQCGANFSIPSELGATALHHSAGIGTPPSFLHDMDFLVEFMMPRLLMLVSVDGGASSFVVVVVGFANVTGGGWDCGLVVVSHANSGDIELLSFMLSRGANVNSQSDSGTPLIWAAGHAQEDAVGLLLEHHANPNTETDDNITPLLSAVAAGSLACLELLIQAQEDKEDNGFQHHWLGQSPNLSFA